jgi:plasmid stabilization system protein ParE
VKRYSVVILPAAEYNIQQAYDWIAHQNEPAAAIRWYNQLMELILSLATFPERAPLAPEAKSLNKPIRELFHGRRAYKYRILFTVSHNQVHILHVRHGARLAIGETFSEE